MLSSAKDISSHSKPATAAMSQVRVLIAAGGTGGHVYPAIAIADSLSGHNNVEILFAGTKKHMEWEAVPKAGYDIVSIWISGLHRRFTLKNLMFPIKLASSLIQSFKIISEFKPQVVVACGGYASGPVGWVAAKRNIPLVIQEQNSFPGITNRLLAKHASKIYAAFKDVLQYLPEDKTVISGNPTRQTLTEADTQESYKYFGFSENKRTLLVLGGSGGAKTINEAMSANIEYLHDRLELQIIWQCGSRYYDELHMNLNTDSYKNLKLFDFIHGIDKAYTAADLVVSRSGALSCSELALTGNPSILIPSPNVAGDHQTKNAQSMVEEGAAELLRDHKAVKKLGEWVNDLIFDEDRLHRMHKAALELARPEAAKQIAGGILKLANLKTPH